MELKKISKTILLLIVFSFTFILIACKDEEVVPHNTHIFSEEWQMSTEEHWHPCTIKGCKEVFDKGKHIYEEGSNTCSVCGYVKGTKPITPDPDTDPDTDPEIDPNATVLELLSDNFKMSINLVTGYEDSDYDIYRVGNDFMSVHKIIIDGYGTQIIIDYYKYYAGTKKWTHYYAVSDSAEWTEKETNLSENDVLFDSVLDLKFVLNYPEKPEDLESVVNKGGKEDLYLGNKKYECTVYTTPDNQCRYHICMISGLQHTLKTNNYGTVFTVTKYEIGGVSFPTFPGEIPDLP